MNSTNNLNLTNAEKTLNKDHYGLEKEMIGTCPRCGQPVYEGKKNFACSDRSCGFVLWKNDRFWTSRKKELTKKMATDLLKKGRTNVKGMWSEKKQATYDAAVILLSSCRMRKPSGCNCLSLCITSWTGACAWLPQRHGSARWCDRVWQNRNRRNSPAGAVRLSC